ncbi:Non-specific lipid transfer protein GPI-anchored 16 [Linum perenne]
MESRKLWSVCLTIMLISSTVKAQISTPCTTSMISSFTPCINFITGSSSNGSLPTSPTAGCCDALKELVTASMDCACLVVTASVPIQLPFVPPLSISLPRACNMGVPLRCRASVSPLPAPGPALLRTSDAPAPAPQSSIGVEESPAPAPNLMMTELTLEAENPTATVDGRPFVNVSASVISQDVSHYVVSIYNLQNHRTDNCSSSLISPSAEMGWKAAEKLIRHWKILRGDNVMITRGKDKGETGVIKRVIRSQNRVIVEGKNLVKKHIKAGEGHEGGIFTVEAPLHASNVQVVDPVTGRPCKIGIKYLEDGTKVRVSRGIGASESIIPRPEILKIRTTPRPTVAGPKDTPIDLVQEKTYDSKTGKGMPEL